jgi:predicted NBD/HSP70 family sugar kinase
MSEVDPPAERALPRPTMLREMTDRAVLDEVFTHHRVTRAELAASTGISKPTISESVRRLEGAGLLSATGSRTGMRGRVATFYELAPHAGHVLAIAVDQDGVRTLSTDLAGRSFDELHEPPVTPGDVDALIAALRRTVTRSLAIGNTAHGAARAVAMSVANPVDPVTRRIIALPDSPFPEGLLSPGEILADLVQVSVLIDNDVNLAALAERRTGAAVDASSFAYLHVGAGLGLGLYIGDQLVRGAHGLAGEIGYLTTASATGERWTTATALARQGFGRSDAPSNDVQAVLGMISRAEAGDAGAVEAVRRMGATIGQAIAATCVVVDPELVLLGGPIGSSPALLHPVRAAVAEISPSPVRIELGRIGESAPLRGALHLALEHGRAQLTSSRA